MKRASITQAKNNLSSLVDGLKNGSPVLIVDRGRPVARLEPVLGGHEGDEDRLSRLVREGLVRPRRKELPPAILAEPPPSAAAGASIVEALIAERREGR